MVRSIAPWPSYGNGRAWYAHTGSATLVVLLVFAAFPLGSIGTIPLQYNLGTGLAGMPQGFVAEQDNQNLGFSTGSGTPLSIVGDLNGDGYEDLAIGSPTFDQGLNNRGRVYLFFGPGKQWNASTTVGSADVILTGEAAEDQLGMALSGVGDVNDDGIDDMAIGAPRSDRGAGDSGCVYLLFGHTGPWSGGDISTLPGVMVLLGNTGSEFAGSAIAGGGDIDDDGIADLVVGAPNWMGLAANAGAAYLIRGRPTWPTSPVFLGNSGTRIYADSQGLAGTQVSLDGDLDGDGFDDLVIGAPQFMSPAPQAGRVYLIRGGAGPWPSSIPVETAANGIITGLRSQHHIGVSLDIIGDANGDGRDDLLLGSPDNNLANSSLPECYLHQGSANFFGAMTDVSAATSVLTTTIGGGRLCRSIVGVGDIDDDGMADIAIGAPYAFDQGLGTTYLLQGRASWPPSADISSLAGATYLAEGNPAAGGFTLGAGGDIDDDGLPDLLVSQPDLSASGPNRGKVSLIHPTHEPGPTTILSLTVYGDAAHAVPISVASPGQRLYLRIEGTGGDLQARDLTKLHLQVDDGSGPVVPLVLRETDVQSHLFDGEVTLGAKTNPDAAILGAALGDDILLTSAANPAITALLPVVPLEVHLDPSDGNLTEDDVVTFTASVVNGTASSLTLATTAPFLDVDADLHTATGTPNNGDIGTYTLTATAIDRWSGLQVDRTLGLTVVNTPPTILTIDVPLALVGSEYRVPYRSDDDGQGFTSWALLEAPAWLDIEAATTELFGTPQPSDVGTDAVSLRVDDGNGGRTFANFSIEVRALQEAPLITSTNLPDAFEDSLYQANLTAASPLGLPLTWSLQTNATWLTLDPQSGRLSGTPRNEQVGQTMLQLRVSDPQDRNDSRTIVLEVQNTNDPPLFLTDPPGVVTVGETFHYSPGTQDPDVGDDVAVILRVGPTGMALQGDPPILQWVPTVGDGGITTVELVASDGDSQTVLAFSLLVNLAPRIDIAPPATVRAGDLYLFDIPVTDDGHAAPVSFSLSSAPAGMTVGLSDGQLRWSPTATDVGNLSVTLVIADGIVAVPFPFTITVLPTDAPAPPQIELVAPGEGAAVHTTVPLLRWRITDGGEGPVRCTVLLSVDRASVGTRDPAARIGATPTGVEQLQLTDSLVPGTTYFWSVLAEDSLWQVASQPPRSFTISAVATEDWPPLPQGPERWVTVAGSNGTVQLNGTDPEHVRIGFLLEEGPSGLSISPEGLVHWRTSRADIGTHTVRYLVDDGVSQSEGLLIIEVRGVPIHDAGLPLGVLALIAALGLVATGVGLLVWRQRQGRAPVPPTILSPPPPAIGVEPFHVASVLLLHQDGRLLQHLLPSGAESLGQGNATEADIVGAMLVAIQGFVQQSFATDRGLDRFGFDRFTVVLRSQGPLLGAVVVEGTPPAQLEDLLERIVVSLHAEYGALLEVWDGDPAAMVAMGPSLTQLLELEQHLEVRTDLAPIKVRSAMEYFQGYLRLKVSVANNGATPASSVRLTLRYDHSYLRLARIEPELARQEDTVTLGEVPSGERRAVAFLLDPLICQESVLRADLSYTDGAGAPQTMQMKERHVDVVCPVFYTPQTVNVAILRRLLARSTVHDLRRYRPATGGTLHELYLKVKDVIAGYDIRLVRELEGSDTQSVGDTESATPGTSAVAWFYGKVPATSEELVVAVIANSDAQAVDVTVTCSNLASLTGLLADIAHQVGRVIPGVLTDEGEDEQQVLERALRLLQLLDPEEGPDQGRSSK